MTLGGAVATLLGPQSPTTRVTLGSLYAGPAVSHLYVVVQDHWGITNPPVALACATAVFLFLYGCLLGLWMHVFSITLDCDRCLSLLQSNRNQQRGHDSGRIGISRHAPSIYWITHALTSRLLSPSQTAASKPPRRVMGKLIQPKLQPRRLDSQRLRRAQTAIAVGLWLALDGLFHVTVFLEHILRLRTVVIALAQLLFCFYGVSAFLFDTMPEGKFGLSVADLWLWKVLTVIGCALWHVALPVSPQWERGARFVGFAALMTIFVGFSSVASVVSLEWDDSDIVASASLLPMTQEQRLGSMSHHDLSLPFTSSLLISSIVLTMGYDSGRSLLIDNAVSGARSLPYARIRQLAWRETLVAQLWVVGFVTVLSVLAVTSVHHSFGGHTMLTNVIVKVSNYVHLQEHIMADVDNEGTAASHWRLWFWTVAAQVSCLVALTAMVPGYINACVKQSKLLAASQSRLRWLHRKKPLLAGAVNALPDTLGILTCEAHLTTSNGKPEFQSVAFVVAALALLPTLVNNAPYGSAPLEINGGSFLPSFRALLRSVDDAYSFNWVALLFTISIFVEFVVPCLGGVGLALSSSDEALRLLSADNAIYSKQIRTLRMRRLFACSVSLATSIFLMVLANVYL